MKIVCAAEMPFATNAFETIGDVKLLPGRHICNADVREAGILAIRSTTRVDSRLLGGTGVKFVGTATIGKDHMDVAWMEKNGISWAHAPGCNANSVSEYITAALLNMAALTGASLADKTIGVIGCGHVGSLVAAKAAALGMRVIVNDPPKQRLATTPGEKAAYRELDDLLAASDFVTLHVPLTTGGADPTFHLCNTTFFEMMKHGATFINSARGPVVDTTALLSALRRGRVARAVIDTWEDEPACNPELIAAAHLATPHIAGYSFEGKVNGTVMVYQAACKFLGIQARWTPDALMPKPAVPLIEIDSKHDADHALVNNAVRRVYDIERDSRNMKHFCTGNEKERSIAFDRLRNEYFERREFSSAEVRLAASTRQAEKTLASLGFKVPAKP